MSKSPLKELSTDHLLAEYVQLTGVNHDPAYAPDHEFELAWPIMRELLTRIPEPEIEDRLTQMRNVYKMMGDTYEL